MHSSCCRSSISISDPCPNACPGSCQSIGRARPGTLLGLYSSTTGTVSGTGWCRRREGEKELKGGWGEVKQREGSTPPPRWNRLPEWKHTLGATFGDASDLHGRVGRGSLLLLTWKSVEAEKAEANFVLEKPESSWLESRCLHIHMIHICLASTGHQELEK